MCIYSLNHEFSVGPLDLNVGDNAIAKYSPLNRHIDIFVCAVIGVFRMNGLGKMRKRVQVPY